MGKRKNTNTRRRRLAQARAKGKQRQEDARKLLAQSGTLAGTVAMTSEELMDTYVEQTFSKVSADVVVPEVAPPEEPIKSWYDWW
jgi:hypothetical protein